MQTDESHEPIRSPRSVSQIDVAPVFVIETAPVSEPVVREAHAPGHHEREHHGMSRWVAIERRPIDAERNGRDAPIGIVKARVVEGAAEREDHERGYHVGCGGLPPRRCDRKPEDGESRGSECREVGNGAIESGHQISSMAISRSYQPTSKRRVTIAGSSMPIRTT